MSSWKRIAVGLAPNHDGRDAVVLGELLARLAGAELLAVRVPPRHELRSPDHLAELELALERAVGASAVPRAALVPDRGPAVRELIRLAGADPEIAAIVLGSSHHAGIGRVVPGGVAERLMAGAPCVVAVAPRGYGADSPADEPRVVGVAYNSTPESEAALALAASIAATAGATLRVITVGPPNLVLDPELRTQITDPELDPQSRLHAAIHELPAEIRAQPIYDQGIPEVAILERAEQGIDLLVIGSRGHSPVGLVLLGSTSSAVISAAPCPVVAVPRPAAAATPN